MAAVQQGLQYQGDAAEGTHSEAPEQPRHPQRLPDLPDPSQQQSSELCLHWVPEHITEPCSLQTTMTPLVMQRGTVLKVQSYDDMESGLAQSNAVSCGPHIAEDWCPLAKEADVGLQQQYEICFVCIPGCR